MFANQVVRCRRKGVGEQAQEKLTPDSQKSTFDKASESISSGADKVTGAVQPGEHMQTLYS